ncbi:MAG: hypothetical protein E6J90_13320 [Deltaproteobacteria bacterium]|nr:MAG: hypothetical protein E6J91_39265 [Deltaproteobacteria bacterium]TMQ21946.1 MAG: hypothetical protein E6J90_13320 [Deltaproteobacteria bacterium]
MTTPKRSVAPEADDLSGVPFIDDAERDESAWLLARDADPRAPAPSLTIAIDYAEIMDLLASLPPGASDEPWHDEVLRAALSMAPPSRPWWRRAAIRWATAGALAAAAAAVVLTLISRAPVAELEVETYSPDLARSHSEDLQPVVGDQLVVTAHTRETSDLRVFRSNGTLVAKCPHGPACRARPHGEYAIDLTLEAPGQYHVILVVGMTGTPPGGTMNEYLHAVDDAHARVVKNQSINVR